MAIRRNYDLLSEWTRYREGLCDGCHARCCMLPVEVSVHDLLRLGLTDEDEAGRSLKKLARRLMSDGVIRDFHAKTQLFVLEQQAGGECIYLDTKTRRCTVYSKRPEVCREFPKRVGPRPGYCPAGPK